MNPWFLGSGIHRSLRLILSVAMCFVHVPSFARPKNSRKIYFEVTRQFEFELHGKKYLLKQQKNQDGVLLKQIMLGPEYTEVLFSQRHGAAADSVLLINKGTTIRASAPYFGVYRYLQVERAISQKGIARVDYYYNFGTKTYSVLDKKFIQNRVLHKDVVNLLDGIISSGLDQGSPSGWGCGPQSQDSISLVDQIVQRSTEVKTDYYEVVKKNEKQIFDTKKCKSRLKDMEKSLAEIMETGSKNPGSNGKPKYLSCLKDQGLDVTAAWIEARLEKAVYQGKIFGNNPSLPEKRPLITCESIQQGDVDAYASYSSNSGQVTFYDRANDNLTSTLFHELVHSAGIESEVITRAAEGCCSEKDYDRDSDTCRALQKLLDPKRTVQSGQITGGIMQSMLKGNTYEAMIAELENHMVKSNEGEVLRDYVNAELVSGVSESITKMKDKKTGVCRKYIFSKDEETKCLKKELSGELSKTYSQFVDKECRQSRFLITEKETTCQNLKREMKKLATAFDSKNIFDDSSYVKFCQSSHAKAPPAIPENRFSEMIHPDNSKGGVLWPFHLFESSAFAEDSVASKCEITKIAGSAIDGNKIKPTGAVPDEVGFKTNTIGEVAKPTDTLPQPGAPQSPIAEGNLNSGAVGSPNPSIGSDSSSGGIRLGKYEDSPAPRRNGLEQLGSMDNRTDISGSVKKSSALFDAVEKSVSHVVSAIVPSAFAASIPMDETKSRQEMSAKLANLEAQSSRIVSARENSSGESPHGVQIKSQDAIQDSTASQQGANLKSKSAIVSSGVVSKIDSMPSSSPQSQSQSQSQSRAPAAKSSGPLALEEVQSLSDLQKLLQSEKPEDFENSLKNVSALKNLAENLKVTVVTRKGRRLGARSGLQVIQYSNKSGKYEMRSGTAAAQAH